MTRCANGCEEKIVLTLPCGHKYCFTCVKREKVYAPDGRCVRCAPAASAETSWWERKLRRRRRLRG